MSGFRGFADFSKDDFASTSGSTTAAATLARVRQTDSKKNSSLSDSENRSDSPRSNVRPSPIYTGSDARLLVLFRKIGQKRDSATKIRALEELSQCVFPPIVTETANGEDFSRHEKIAALCHLVFLHETKLGYDNNFSVRAGSYKALTASKAHVPRAWKGLFVGEIDGKSSDDALCPAATTVGMAWIASRGDPAADVAKNASAFIAGIADDETEAATKVIKAATCNYSKAVLTCKRASSLQDVINPSSAQSTSSGVHRKSTDNSVKNKKNKAEISPISNVSEKEETEECYERVILSVLSGLGWLVQCHPEYSGMNQLYVDMVSFPDPSCFTRILQSSRGSFRREAYNFVGKICQFAPSLILPESASLQMAPLIPNLLSSERESSNFSPLLEMVLTYFAAFRTEHKNALWEKLDCGAFTKSLSKSLRRACYGAPASAWCPMILPLLASLPCQQSENVDSPAPLVAVESLWEGRNDALSVIDKASIVSAVIECVTFFLLRPSKDTYPLFSLKSLEKCGKLLVDTLSYYLTGLPSVKGLAEAALDDLSLTISRDLRKLDESSFNADLKERGINRVQWLWAEEGLQTVFSLEENQTLKVKRFKSLLTHLSTTRQLDPSSHLLPSCRNLFRSIIWNIASYNDKTCKEDEGELLLAIMCCCEIGNLFPTTRSESSASTISVEDFILNDLLRWILVHGAASQRSSIEVDFKVLKMCLNSISSVSTQREIWETVLRELIKACCDYTTISDGLLLMVGYEIEKCSNYKTDDVVKCKILDTFAADTADSFANSFQRSHDVLRDDSDDEEEICVKRKGDSAHFLRTCAGMSSPSFGLLVSPSVVKQWIVSCCQSKFNSIAEKTIMHEDDSGSNALLHTLLSLKAIPSTSFISNEEAVKLLFESWHEGGRIWSKTAVKLLESGPLKDDFIVYASSCLCAEVKSQPPADHAVLELVCQAWAMRAKRLFDISGLKSLESVGLNNALLWDLENRSEFLFLCLMHLLYLVDSKDRWELLFKNHDNKLFVHILRCISDISSPLVNSFESRTVRNQQLAEIIGGCHYLSSSLVDCCDHNIDLLSSLANETGKEETTNQTLTALSFLISLLFSSVRSFDEMQGVEDDVSPTSVKEGDSLWYEKGEGERIKATVVKVHFDDFPDLYFTIRLDASNVEKQTVAKKLKRSLDPVCDEIPENSLSNTDSMADVRDRLGRCIVDKLLQRNNIGVSEVAAECINIIISQCGFTASGIGSVKYDVFKIVSSVESLLCDTMTNPVNEVSLNKCIPLLRFLSLSMGYGIYTIPSWKNTSVLKLDPSGSVGRILDLYEDSCWIAAQRSDPIQPFHASVTMWLTVTFHAIADVETYRRSLSTIRLLSDILLQHGDSAANSFYILNAVTSVESASCGFSDHTLVESEDEKEVLLQLTRCFVNDSELVSSAWIDTFSSLLRMKGEKFRCIFLQAAKSFSNELVNCLFTPQRRWCAFQVLDAFMADKDQDSLQPDDSVIQQQFAAWKVDMDEEEAVEMEEDIRVTASWMPSKLMSILKSVGEGAAFDHENKNLQMGYLLAWIACLNIMDSAGTADMRNRSSLGAFVKQTKALGVIMEIALSEGDLGKNDKENIFACTHLDSKTDFVAGDIALLVLFRTVEALPTLVKTWFNDDCPKYWQQKFSAFVEKRVAPATLQRELDRIKKASCFDEMSVNGSAASREVVATYQQDECQLSVMIKIPPTFPLRNVEVDCQKTLGIPSSRWRRWALQIMLMLNNQDGNILEALLLWKRNVDKEFDGVEPCPVCYSVLCIKTHAMPNLECKTCNNRFHTTCLYKWFQSSGKSQCVLCQQPWSGTKI